MATAEQTHRPRGERRVRRLYARRLQQTAAAIATAWAACLLSAPAALAISAPIRIANTDGQGVLMRPTASTSGPAVGWIAEGASPDYNCFVWGERIGNVPIWFHVNHNGVSGFYSSYYDDSSYQSNEELTAKYGVPLCGSDPIPQQQGTQPPPPMPPQPSGVSGAAVYFSPYERGSRELADRSVKTVYKDEFANGCSSSWPAYRAARSVAGTRPITTMAGWSSGRVGVISYLKRASDAQLRLLHYVLLIDPGTFGEMTCDRDLRAGERLVRWLRLNPNAHLVVISGTQVSQKQSSRGIQESYFNTIRDRSRPPQLNLRPRVLTCNYAIDHQRAFRVAQYWIAHEIGGSSTSCPWLSERGQTFKPAAGWHP